MDKIKAIKNIGKLKLLASTVEEIERDTETEIEKIEDQFRGQLFAGRLMTSMDFQDPQDGSCPQSPC